MKKYYDLKHNSVLTAVKFDYWLTKVIPTLKIAVDSSCFIIKKRYAYL